MRATTIIKRAVGYGLLMVVIWLIVLFILSLIFQFETAPAVPAVLVFSVVMALVVRLFIIRLKPANLKEAFIYSVSWTVITFLVVLIITIPNGTIGNIFGNWAMYLVVILMILAPTAISTPRS